MRTPLVVVGIVAGLAACSGGFTTTERVGSVESGQVCLERLDGRTNAVDVRCFDPASVAGAADLETGDCVEVDRRGECRCGEGSTKSIVTSASAPDRGDGVFVAAS